MTASTLEDLRGEIVSIEGRLIELEAERSELSYAAMIEKNTDAVKRLDKVNAEIIRIVTVTLPTLRAAIEEAERREAVATATAADQDVRDRAEKARPIAERLAERGAKMDAAIAEYRLQFAGIHEDLNGLIALGVPTASRALVRVNLTTAHTWATAVDSSARPVPPNRRHSFDFLTTGWSQPARKWIAEKIGKTNPAEAA